MNYIPWILFIIGVSFIFVKVSELLLPEKNQESLKQALRGVEEEVCHKGAEWTALSPIYYMSVFLDKYLGKKLVSRRSISIASILASILVISTVWLTNIPPNKGDFLEKSPSKLWNRDIELIEKMPIKSMNLESGKPEELEKQREYIRRLKEREEWFLKLKHSGGVYIFSIVLLLSCLVSMIILSSLTLAITRQVLREMVYAKGFWTLMGGAIINVLLVLVLSSFFYLLLLFISIPRFWYLWDGLILMTLQHTLIVYPLGSILAYLILPEWVKLVVLVSIIPIILLAFTLLLSALIFIFRRPIHSTVLHLLRRALEWKAGPISFFATLLALVTFIINMIYNYLQ
jgi:hypothetical protein